MKTLALELRQQLASASLVIGPHSAAAVRVEDQLQTLCLKETKRGATLANSKQSALDNIQKTTLNEIDTVLRLSRLKVHPHLNLPRYIAHLKQKFLGPMEAEAERSC
jgi:hypothetical protein